MRDDDEFREHLNAAADDFRSAVLRAIADPPENLVEAIEQGIEDLIFGPEFDLGETYDIFGNEERLRNLFKQFRGFNITSGTEKTGEILHASVVDKLEQLAVRGGSPLETIAGRLEEWTGSADSAADVFKNDYMPALTGALEYELDVARSLLAINNVHEGIVLAGRAAILTILDQTIAALGTVAESRGPVVDLGAIVSAVIGTLGNPAVGVRHLVASTLAAVGTSFAEALGGVAGDTIHDVIDSMEHEIGDLNAAIRAEEERVQDALDHVLDFVRGDRREDFLPPNVNPPEPAMMPTSGPF